MAKNFLQNLALASCTLTVTSFGMDWLTGQEFLHWWNAMPGYPSAIATVALIATALMTRMDYRAY